MISTKVGAFEHINFFSYHALSCHKNLSIAGFFKKLWKIIGNPAKVKTAYNKKRGLEL